MFSRDRYKEEMSDEKRAMIVIGIFIIGLIAFMAVIVIINMPPPAAPPAIAQNVTPNFIRNVTMVR
jgi:hypothetical protein